MTSDARATAMTLAALLEVDPTVAARSTRSPPASRRQRAHDGAWGNTAGQPVGARRARGVRASARRAAPRPRRSTVGGKQIAKKTIAGAQVVVLRVPLDKLRDDHVAIAVDRGAHVERARHRGARRCRARRSRTASRSSARYLDARGEPITTLQGRRPRHGPARRHRRRRASLGRARRSDPGRASRSSTRSSRGDAGAAQARRSRAAAGGPTVTWDHQELRDDRVQWFADRMGAGHYHADVPGARDDRRARSPRCPPRSRRCTSPTCARPQRQGHASRSRNEASAGGSRARC